MARAYPQPCFEDRLCDKSAQMAELVDAPSSGGGARKGVEVRVLFWAPFVLLTFSQIIYKTRRNPRDLALGSFRIVPPVLGGSRHFCGPFEAVSQRPR